MSIAILGWGAPIANHGHLQLMDGRWHPSGPLLPIEFARISNPATPRERLTLVLHSEAARDVPTFWALSRFSTVREARQNLAEAEELGGETPVDCIGYLARGGRVDPGHTRREVVRRIADWLDRQDRAIEAVLWVDLDSNFTERASAVLGRSVRLDETAVVDYLRWLAQNNPAAGRAAEQYVRCAPEQVRTVLREHVEWVFGWEPARPVTPPADQPPLPQAPHANATPAGSAADALWLKDWVECRTTIGRLDTILVDLRKLGFTFITGLLTAGALLGSNQTPASPVAFMTIMVLIAALFAVDTYYSVLLSGAVERALDLEDSTDWQLRVSQQMSLNATRSATSFVTMLLYLVLVGAAAALGIWFAGGLGLHIWSIGPQVVLALLGAAAWASSWLVGIAVLLVVYLAYLWGLPAALVERTAAATTGSASTRTSPPRLGAVIGGVLAVWLSAGLGLLLLSSGSAGGTANAGAAWVTRLGTLIAVSIEVYWFYVAWQSGIYKHRQR